MVTGVHEKVPLRVRREGRYRGVDRVRRSLGATVPGHESKVHRFQADPTGAGRVLRRAIDRVLEEVEDVHRRAPLRRITGAGAHCDGPGWPRHPAWWIELQLH